MAIRITQAGVALTVGIIIVTGLIVGGFFLVKNNGEQARRDEAIKIAQQNLEDRSGDDVAITTDDSDANKEEDKLNNGEVSGDQASESESTSTSTGVGAEDQASTRPAETVGELPRTGVADQLSSVLTLALLTFSAASYVSSRRQA